MIELGKYQEMEIRRFVDFGAYLALSGENDEILIPQRYLPDNVQLGDTIEVFVYNDSENRPIATTERPYATVGEFAFLEVSDVNEVGAFLDWGLPTKHLLVPFREQRNRMRPGGVYLVYIYVDDNSHRIVASAKTDKFLGNVLADYRNGDKVDALVVERTEIGYKVIVDNLHKGIIYSNEIFRPIQLREHIHAFVKRVRDDGKIDLTLNDKAAKRQAELGDRIIEYLGKPNAVALSDKSSPELIESLFSCSKKDFKKAVGHLYRARRITLSPTGTLTLPL